VVVVTRWRMLLACALTASACGNRAGSPDYVQKRVILQVPASAFRLDAGSFLGPEWGLWRTGALVDTLELTEAVHSLAIEARGTSCEGAWPLVECTWNGIQLGKVRVTSTEWAWYRLGRGFGPGRGVLRIALLNDRFSRRGDLNLFVRAVTLSGENR